MSNDYQLKQLLTAFSISNTEPATKLDIILPLTSIFKENFLADNKQINYRSFQERVLSDYLIG